MLTRYRLKYVNFIVVLIACLSGSVNATQNTPQDLPRFDEIIEAASFANVSYQSEADIVQFIKSRDYSLALFRTLPETQVSYFIATNEITKTQVIAVRGTSNIENTVIDVSLKLMDDERTGIRLHQGFSYAASQAYADLQPLLKKDYEINVVGHSLGGAVALILGMYLDIDKFNIGQITTFGQPKVTNMAGARQFAHLKVIRVVTMLDLVPLVPPFDPLDLNNLDIYWHSGKEILLLDDNKFSILEGMNSMLRATKFTQNRLSAENLKNHQMSFYLAMLNEKLNAPEHVEHENSFNLFNLFGG